MRADEAFQRLKPELWARTPIASRISLLKEVRANLATHADELTKTDTQVKNAYLGELIFTESESKLLNIAATGNILSTCINLYKTLKSGRFPNPISVEEIKPGLFDIKVFPRSLKHQLLAGEHEGFIRVINQPEQISPMEKPAGVIAVISAGNFNSIVESIKALFLDNCAVIHKPHPFNAETNRLWEIILKPLIDINAITFCNTDQSDELSKLKGLRKIYFSGTKTETNKIIEQTDTPIIAEYGGNNPCIIVPSETPWKAKEIEHHAVQIASIAKLNGGAISGRIQVIITAKRWPQREAFINSLRTAIENKTPATGCYLPPPEPYLQYFRDHYPDAEILTPEAHKYKKQNTEFLFITNAAEDSYAVKNDAYSQVLTEICLDVEPNAEDFLNAATDFCNSKLFGTLGCCILIDPKTQKAHKPALEKAISALDYGSVAINAMLPSLFLNAYMTWGGNNKDNPYATDKEDFGNVFCYQNVEKSILFDNFISKAHWLHTNKAGFYQFAKNISEYATKQSWRNIYSLILAKLLAPYRTKDF